MQFYVYILCTRPQGALYVGVTNDLRRRMEQHRSNAVRGHVAKYNIHRLAWYETHQELEHARQREKRIKRWRRQWKIELIESVNPTWRDMALEIPL